MPGVDTSIGNVAGSFGTLHFGLPKITVSDRGLAFGFTPDAGSMSVLGSARLHDPSHFGGSLDGIGNEMTSAMTATSNSLPTKGNDCASPVRNSARAAPGLFRA